MHTHYRLQFSIVIFSMPMMAIVFVTVSYCGNYQYWSFLLLLQLARNLLLMVPPSLFVRHAKRGTKLRVGFLWATEEKRNSFS